MEWVEDHHQLEASRLRVFPPLHLPNSNNKRHRRLKLHEVHHPLVPELPQLHLHSLVHHLRELLLQHLLNLKQMHHQHNRNHNHNSKHSQEHHRLAALPNPALNHLLQSNRQHQSLHPNNQWEEQHLRVPELQDPERPPHHEAEDPP